MKQGILLILSISLNAEKILAFSLNLPGSRVFTRSLSAVVAQPPTKILLMSKKNNGACWTSLIEQDGVSNTSTIPVKKLVLEKGTGEIPKLGSTVEIQYVGTLGSSPMNWAVEDVVECWLKSQQGLYDILAQPFRDNNVDGNVLMNEDVFNEAFVTEPLGVENKILCKKTVMAAKRLKKQTEEYPEGTEFDSSLSRGNTFKFDLGKGKVIKAMDLLVSSMRVGDKAKVICRADYGYGSEGYRKANGEIVVPPFATLCFEVTLLSIS